MSEHLVIIGGVAAGAKAAAKARRLNPNIKITIYNESEHVSYSACGLPYFIEGIIQESKKLFIRLPEQFKEKDNINVFVKHKVIKISPEFKKIEVLNLDTNKRYEVEYTKLLIATGASPILPKIEGLDLKNVFDLRTVEDAIAIKNRTLISKKVVIIGAGYIGLELLESFSAYDVEITIIERADQILPVYDADITVEIHKFLTEEKNIKIITNDAVQKLIGDSENNLKQVQTSSGMLIDADIAVIAIGVKPNTEIAKNARIETGITGAIKVNEKMETNIPDIYAAGDCAEQVNLITGKSTWIPLGSTANKQGRTAAINMTGGSASFNGILGSNIFKLFEYTVSGTGLSETEAQKAKIDYETTTLIHKDTAGYMPGSQIVTIKLLAEKATHRIIGAHVIGKGDADKRTNIFATAITAKMTTNDLINLDLAYAPPFSPTIDPVIMSAQLLQAKLENKTE